MNIEDSIKTLKEFNKIKINSYAMQFVNISYPELQQTIKTLLTAYEEEKEKREIAEENHKVLSLDLGKALKELGLYEDTIIADELVLEINKRFVSKDRIKQIQIIDLDGIIHNVYRIEEE